MSGENRGLRLEPLFDRSLADATPAERRNSLTLLIHEITTSNPKLPGHQDKLSRLWAQVAEHQAHLALFDDSIHSALRALDYGFRTYENVVTAKLFNLMGSMCFHKGELQQALLMFERAIKLHRGSRITHFNRAMVFFDMGDSDSALADVQQVLQSDSNDLEALNMRGIIFLKRNETLLALSDFDRALQINRTFAPALANRGLIHLNLGNFAEAYKDFSKALASDKTNPRLWNNRGIASSERGERQQALADFEEALRLDPTYEPAQMNIMRLRQVA